MLKHVFDHVGCMYDHVGCMYDPDTVVENLCKAIRGTDITREQSERILLAVHDSRNRTARENAKSHDDKLPKT